VSTYEIPEPVFDENPGWIEFYFEAWRIASDHIRHREGAVASPYMDEGFDPDTIWIWDTCFMLQFCKYAFRDFPGIQSLDNFYGPLHGAQTSSLAIQHPDNPPLFAWTEIAYARFTGDRARLERVLPVLVEHFEFIEQAHRGQTVAGGVCSVAAERTPVGYFWSGISSGMDNTPRGRGDYENMLWFDLLAQQALSATCISEIAGLCGRTEISRQFSALHAELMETANTDYWDEEAGTYFDIRPVEPYAPVRVKTPAAYWGMLAGFCDAAKCARLASLASDLRTFGGQVPWPSVSRDDPDYHQDGYYWQGGIWLPTAYMATVALRQTGFALVGDNLAENLLAHMYRTWRDYEPHTIWEAYSPTEAKPATDKAEFAGNLVRPDFCGWSALGPISLFIESVLGFSRVDALENTIVWRPRPRGRNGLRDLRFGDIRTSLVSDGSRITIESTGDYTLHLPWQTYSIASGTTRIRR